MAGWWGDHRVLPAILLMILLCGQPVRTECPTCTGSCRTQNIDIAFVIDGSGSICNNEELGCQNWRNILQFVVSMVDHFTIGYDRDRVGIVQFSNEAVLEFPLSTYTTKETLKQAILRINHRGGNTNTSGGIRLMRTQLFFSLADRLDKQNVAMVVTDGRSTRDADRTIPEAKAAQDAGIFMYSLGVTPSVDIDEVKQISSYPRQLNYTYWLIRTFDILSSYQVTDSIFTSACADQSAAGSPSVDNTVSRCPGKVIGQDCYIIQEASAPWAVADTQCSRLAAIIGQPGAGRLAMPKSLQVMAQLTAYIQDIRAGKSFSERENLAAFWVGGHEEGTQFGDPAYPVWRWLSGLTLLQDQGCFTDRASSADMESRGVVSDLTRERCLSLCTGYQYVGVQNGNLCSCGDTYGRHGTTDVCSTPCVGDSTTTCGGLNANRVLRVGGAFGQWAPGQPNNYNQKQSCGALMSTDGGRWGLNDYACYEKLSYICSLPFSSCSQGNALHHYLEDTCLQLVTTTLSWFKAREDCQSRGGDLVSVNRNALHAGIEYLLFQVYKMASPFWVGAVGRRWKWYDGEEMTYTHWSDNEPNEASKSCLKMAANSQDVIWWEDEACDTTLPYICHIDLSMVVTTTTTTTPTTTTTKQPTDNSLVNLVASVNQVAPSTAPPTTTASNGTEPDLGASTDVQGSIMTSAYYFLIAFGIVLLFVIVAIAILIWMHKHKNVSLEKTAEAYTTPKLESFHKVSPMTVSEEVTPAPPTESRWKKPQAMMSYVHQSGDKKPRILSVVDEVIKKKKAKEGASWKVGAETSSSVTNTAQPTTTQETYSQDTGAAGSVHVYEEIDPTKTTPVYKSVKKKRRKKLKEIVNETSSIHLPTKKRSTWDALTKAISPRTSRIDERARDSGDDDVFVIAH